MRMDSVPGTCIETCAMVGDVMCAGSTAACARNSLFLCSPLSGDNATRALTLDSSSLEVEHHESKPSPDP